MRRWWYVFLLAVSLLGTLLTGSTEAKDIDDLPNVAILSFTNKAPVTWDNFGDYAGDAAENLGREIYLTHRFVPIEREELQSILDEHSLQLTGLVDHNTISELGKIEGIDYALLGSITSLTCKNSSGGIQTTGNTDAGVAMRRYKVSATVMLRMVDVRTGRIVLYGRGKAHSDSTLTAANLSGNFVHFGTVQVSEEQCNSAVEKAVHDAIYGKEGILTELDGEG